MKLKLLNEEEFNKFPDNKKRIAICKDVIARIKAEKIVENHGRFWTTFDYTFKEKQSVQEYINANKCVVCAKGAIMCSWVGNFNKVSWDEAINYTEKLYYTNPYPKDLLDIFGRKMLDNIEAAFEGVTFCWHYDELKTRKYVDKFENLTEIMQYIIKNNGEFPVPN